MNDAWNQTQARLRKWQKDAGSSWELRRILSDSQYFKVIGMCAFKRVKNPPQQISWQDWWGFHLERLPEREAMQLLLDAWNKDVWAHLNHQVRVSANLMLQNIVEQSRLAREFAVVLEGIVSEAMAAPPLSQPGEGRAAENPGSGEPGPGPHDA